MINIWLKIVISIEILYLYIYIKSNNNLKLSSFIQLNLVITGDSYNKSNKNSNDNKQDWKSDILKLDNSSIILKQKSKGITDISNKNFTTSNMNLNIDSKVIDEDEINENNISMNYKNKVKECSYLHIEETVDKLVKLKIEITVTKIQIQLHLDKTRFCHGRHKFFSTTSIKCIGSTRKANELSQKLVDFIKIYREEMKIYLGCMEYNSREQSSKIIGYRIHNNVEILKCTTDELSLLRIKKVLEKSRYLILRQSILSISRELESCHRCRDNRNKNLCKKCILMSNCKEHILSRVELLKDKVNEVRNKEHGCENFLALKQSTESLYKDENILTKEKVSYIPKEKSVKLRDSEDNNTGKVNNYKELDIKESVTGIELDLPEDILFQNEEPDVLKEVSKLSRNNNLIESNNKQTGKMALSVQTEVQSDLSNESKITNTKLSELSKTSIDDNVEEENINKSSNKLQSISPTLDLIYKGKDVGFDDIRKKYIETNLYKVKKKLTQPKEQKTKISLKNSLEDIEPRTQQTKIIARSLRPVEVQNHQTKVIFSKKGLSVPLYPKPNCTLSELEKLIGERNKLIKEKNKSSEKVQKELLDMKIKEVENCMLQRTSN
ncbi:uncharacterized protein CMU_001810 [Cryptosporidium muris RN66]|uniref:Uncharacterized protein n=1 Tax=Cryptosporidium muris (strain RN66) TaxID=441375 RepID=B6AGG9_CRYMR|nr:uncharacterized protein CMU_001810 [Cryptosporidium muris RN66]EEA07310.1 hypothetical protein CMU_001810 [Cryptosporidium muris RN66]|eukprot:XP_002141659.1 hypothetical protein [Cryptosporidium muris RN66]